MSWCGAGLRASSSTASIRSPPAPMRSPARAGSISPSARRSNLLRGDRRVLDQLGVELQVAADRRGEILRRAGDDLVAALPDEPFAHIGLLQALRTSALTCITMSGGV